MKHAVQIVMATLCSLAVISFGSQEGTLCPGVEDCLRRLDAGLECAVLPVPERARLSPIPDGQATEVRQLRKGVWLHRDGGYNSLIVRHDQHVVVVDMPDSNAGMNKPDGSRTRMTDAVTSILSGTQPTRIDMVYTHAHFDHIGASTRFHQWASRVYPKSVINVYGGPEVAAAIHNSVSKRAVIPTRVIHKSATIVLSEALRLDIRALHGHSKADMAVHIPRHGAEKAILMFVDVVSPRWAPFWSFAISEDITQYIAVHTELLRYDFDVFVDGHLDPGDRDDVSENLRFTTDLFAAAEEAERSTTMAEFAAAGAQNGSMPGSAEFGNVWFMFITAGRAVQAHRCVRSMIEKWGCRFGGVAATSFSNCFVALSYRFTSL